MATGRRGLSVTRAGVLWAVGVILVATALGWQMLYDAEIRHCRLSPKLLLCAGPLDAWVMPLTLVVGTLLLLIGVWRLGKRSLR